MENSKVNGIYRTAFFVMILNVIASLAFVAGIFWTNATAAENDGSKKPKVIYPKKTELDFEGLLLQGEIKNPGEFYFQRRPEEKFDSLVKRRKNFNREMMRDVVLSK